MTTLRKTSAVFLLAAIPVALSACGGSSSSTTTSSAPAESTSMTSEATTAAAPFGPGCALVPTSGAGSVAEMAKLPVADAAASNPLLTTLAGAVTKAGLGQTLNSAKDITVFAPTNDAFTALPKATLDAAIADPKGLLTKVLTNHVVQGQLTPDMVAGSHKTLAGTTLNVTGSGEKFTVGKANVVCGNVKTANATVYVVDQVLLPS